MSKAKAKALTVIAASVLERAEMPGTDLLGVIVRTVEQIDGCLNDLKVEIAIANRKLRESKIKSPIREEIKDLKSVMDRLLTLRHQLQIHLLASSGEP